MHDKHRREERVTFFSTGLLEINGKKIHCLVDNISTSGVLIKVDDADQKNMHTGETGILKVLLLSPVEYACRIIRICSNNIALKFM